MKQDTRPDCAVRIAAAKHQGASGSIQPTLPSKVGWQLARRGGLRAPRVFRQRRPLAARYQPPIRRMRLERPPATVGAAAARHETTL
jgi:hypothetical protein